MTVPKDGRNAIQPYRVRAGGTWYWVDPKVPRAMIEPGDTVVVYPAGGHAVVAVAEKHPGIGALAFTDLQGERFEAHAGGIVAVHLAAVDDVQ